MRLKLKKSMNEKRVSRLKKKVRLRKKLDGTSERPRLSVYRSLNHIYVQLVDDVEGKTLVSASSIKMDIKGKKGIEVASEIGKEIANKASSKNIEEVIFDRNGFIYHGKIKAVAEAARENGLKF